MNEAERVAAELEWSREYSFGPIYSKGAPRFVRAKQPSESQVKPVVQPQTGSSFYADLVANRQPQASTSQLADPSDATSLEVKASLKESALCPVCNVSVSSMDAHSRTLGHMLRSSDAITPPTYYAINAQNIGRKLLVKNGWVENTGLGFAGDGRHAPVKASDKVDKLGLGLKLKKGEHKPAPEQAKSARTIAREAKREQSRWRGLYSYLKE